MLFAMSLDWPGLSFGEPRSYHARARARGIAAFRLKTMLVTANIGEHWGWAA